MGRSDWAMSAGAMDGEERAYRPAVALAAFEYGAVALLLGLVLRGVGGALGTSDTVALSFGLVPAALTFVGSGWRFARHTPRHVVVSDDSLRVAMWGAPELGVGWRGVVRAELVADDGTSWRLLLPEGDFELRDVGFDAPTWDALCADFTRCLRAAGVTPEQRTRAALLAERLQSDSSD